MSSPAVAKTSAGAVAAPALSPAMEAASKVPGISRREFLYYSWTASLALLLAQSGGLLLWFGLPRFRAGEFGGVFTLSGDALPTDRGARPVDVPAGKFWLSNSPQGVVALYKVCTHLGCLYAWVDANDRFECPCHGSKFQDTGVYIEGPAPRSLDRFEMTIVTKGGQQLVTGPEGDPIDVQAGDVAQILVNTGARIKRAGKA
jgi:cytochrome b6-f complex iron-sulfur subunit